MIYTNIDYNKRTTNPPVKPCGLLEASDANNPSVITKVLLALPVALMFVYGCALLLGVR